MVFVVSMDVSGRLDGEVDQRIEYPATPLPLLSLAPVQVIAMVLSFDQVDGEWSGLESVVGFSGGTESYLNMNKVIQAELFPTLSRVRILK